MQKTLKTLIHSIFWLVFILFNNTFGLPGNPVTWPHISDFMPNYLLNIIWAAVVFYTFYFFVFRYFQRSLLSYSAISVSVIVVMTPLFLLVHSLIVPDISLFHRGIILITLAGSFLISQCGSLIRGFENWFASMQLKSELENISLRNELELLKAQINPHFLFNSLNNIDSLIHRSPDKASDALITLSGILRYMIYETRTDFVSLSKETEHIENYIRLQKMRFKQEKYISFSFDMTPQGVMIPPLLLLTFIENAFKHSCSTGRLPAVEIRLCCAEDELKFYCMNYFDTSDTEGVKTGGIGLENVRRRLELLYPGRHDLKISSEKNTFLVKLNIRLK